MTLQVIHVSSLTLTKKVKDSVWFLIEKKIGGQYDRILPEKGISSQISWGGGILLPIHRLINSHKPFNSKKIFPILKINIYENI